MYIHPYIHLNMRLTPAQTPIIMEGSKRGFKKCPSIGTRKSIIPSKSPVMHEYSKHFVYFHSYIRQAKQQRIASILFIPSMPLTLYLLFGFCMYKYCKHSAHFLSHCLVLQTVCVYAFVFTSIPYIRYISLHAYEHSKHSVYFPSYLHTRTPNFPFRKVHL